MSIWANLAAKDVNEHVKEKGGFSYLAWTWAWASIKQDYSDATYRLLDDQHYSDGSMEVRCEVMIDGMTLPMWLPVTDHRNKAIPNPDAFAVNTARMRCLVKCLAMFGLGHYIYAGESLPQAPGLADDIREDLLISMNSDDSLAFMAIYRLLSQDQQEQFFDSFERGHKTSQKDKVRKLQSEYQAMVEEYVTALIGHSAREDGLGVKGVVEELGDDPALKADVWQRLSDSEKAGIKDLLKGG